MDAASPSQLLANQHREIDAGIQGILAGNGQVSGLVEALTLLRLHLYAEEQVLFPALAKTSAVMAIIAMKREHGQMWPHIEALRAACQSPNPATALRDTCNTLYELLQVHNPKEEKIIYTAADRFAAKTGGTSLIRGLQFAEMPDGWVCEKAPH